MCMLTYCRAKINSLTSIKTYVHPSRLGPDLAWEATNN